MKGEGKLSLSLISSKDSGGETHTETRSFWEIKLLSFIEAKLFKVNLIKLSKLSDSEIAWNANNIRKYYNNDFLPQLSVKYAKKNMRTKEFLIHSTNYYCFEHSLKRICLSKLNFHAVNPRRHCSFTGMIIPMIFKMTKFVWLHKFSTDKEQRVENAATARGKMLIFKML